ncbi:MAG TPA: NAD(P)/FAD-dependent oxidoreductase [Terriglobales bacterium]|nr:NAD(P)/FAD-dependent oxidoreductase [Terriglobales bacterium]
MTRRAVVIGAGHNGLVCAAYLARAGLRVTVVERREVLGGSAVTEEIWPGFKSSRAAYVLGLFRPQIVRELELARHGLRLLPRQPSSFTPLPDGRSLTLGANLADNVAEISRFSRRDAETYPRYETFLERIAAAVEPMLDAPPPQWPPRDRQAWRALLAGARAGFGLGRDLPRAARLLLGPARELLDEWFDSEPLKATLATDAVIGAFASPASPGTGYVLFHHVMGSVTGHRGVWAYVQGGMGQLSTAIAAAAQGAGALVRSAAPVAQIVVRQGRAAGVVLESGEELRAEVVASCADPAVTFGRLVPDGVLPREFLRALGQIDYRSPVFKMNLALDRLPQFQVRDVKAPPPLTGTIHVGSETTEAIVTAFREADQGEVSQRPVVEMTIPSVLDPTLAPEGKYVASIFAQYAPAKAMSDPGWPRRRDLARDRILALVEEVAPGFRDSILHLEVLAPPDLERIFALTGGNIFHGAMTPDRLASMRPVPNWSNYRTPLSGLYLCGSGAHPGGGVIGACGKNAAAAILSDR